MAFDIVRAERLFDKVRVVLLDAAEVLHRLHRVDPAVVAVQHQLHVRPDGFARGLHAGFLPLGVPAPGLHLDRLEAKRDITGHFLADHRGGLAFDVVAAACICGHRVQLDRAQVLVQRQADRLGVQVPQRDIQRADGPHDGTHAALQQRLLVHLLPQPFHAERFLADQHGREQLLHRHPEQLSARAAHVAKADAFHAIDGPHLHQAIVALGHGAVGERGHVVKRHAGDANFDGLDDRHTGLSRVGGE